uniref:Uncharacterized protein n=1 Tax=Utricularia reniformis TaxID=192314 RepID=A0A1Y0B3P7_9LAMI|nr:hypothetical protein AEK19_MT1908 [Utricularia reniformis]ART32076.1 hypothetical protein AEK19_MT1908 [Utricularia reniformis]
MVISAGLCWSLSLVRLSYYLVRRYWVGISHYAGKVCYSSRTPRFGTLTLCCSISLLRSLFCSLQVWSSMVGKAF